MSFFKRLFKPTQPSIDSEYSKDTEVEDGIGNIKQDEVEVEVEDGIGNIKQDVIDYYIDIFAREDLEGELLLELDNFNEHFDTIGSIDLSNRDPLFEDAARLIVIQQQGSTSLIQRKFAIGYNRAGRIMDQLEVAGIVGSFEGNNGRQILITDIYSLEKKLEILDVEREIDLKLKDEIRAKFADLINSKKTNLKDAFYKEMEDAKNAAIELEKEQIRKELLEKERLRKLRRQVKKELVESGHITQGKKREPIPQDIQDKVWTRDGGKCVVCGSSENLEFDHIIPFSRGGSNTYRNLQLLCENCNRKKSNKIG